MTDLISICIPTYQRPVLFTECLASCLSQDYRPLEVVVSDDSADAATERIVDTFRSRTDIPIRYIRNVPPLGQNANVNQLFDLAAGDRLILMHDDDYLLPGCVSTLAACWIGADPLIAYGFQQYVTHDGKPLESASVNARYSRTPDRGGRQPSVIEAALLRQIPNNGYLVKSEACRRVRYRPASEFPVVCDVEFDLRLGAAYREADAVLVPEATTVSRVSLESVTTRSRDAQQTQPDRSKLFDLIVALDLPQSAEHARTAALTWLAPQAIKGYVMRGLTRKAIAAYFSRYYDLKKRLSVHGVYYALIIAAPQLLVLQKRFQPK